jgi:hypothetical protein
MTASATFHVPPPPRTDRWTARQGQQLVGREVAYGNLGRVGVVVRAVPVDSGRALRLHVELSRELRNPDRRKFTLKAAK